MKLSSESSLNSFQQLAYHDQMKPMSIPRQRIQYHSNPKLIQRISLKGEKYISRVAATGEYTLKMLNQLKRTSTIKTIQRLEFDPYFCSESGLRQLSVVLKRFKRGLFRIHLVIRRFKTQEEIERFCSFLVRLNNLVELRSELLNSHELDHGRIKKAMKGYQEFSKLKLLEMKVLGFQNSKSNDFQGFRGLLCRTPTMEKLSYQIQCHKLLENKPENTKLLYLKNDLQKIKSFSLKFSFKTSWIPSFGTEFDKANGPTFWKIIPKIMNPIHLSLSFDKFPLPSIVINDIAGMLPEMTNLRFLSLEITKTRIREFELLMFAQGFLKCKNLEHLTFKYLDNVPLPLSDLVQFITVMAAYSKSPKMDLYFRKIVYAEWDLRETKSMLQKWNNIEYVLTKQSIHFYKTLHLDISE